MQPVPRQNPQEPKVKPQEEENYVFLSSKPTRGVERILFNGHEDIETALKLKVLELARQGKRVVLAPKRMSDGIALDWVYDISVKDQSAESILLELPLEDEHKRGLQYIRRSGSSRSEAILIDSDSDTSSHRSGSSSGSGAYQEVSNSRKRKDRSNLCTCDLHNLPAHTSEDMLRQNLIDSGVPPTAIISIRLRILGTAMTATVDLSSDSHVPSYLQHCLDRASDITRNPLLKALQARRSGVIIPIRDDEREVINLVSDNSDSEDQPLVVTAEKLVASPAMIVDQEPIRDGFPYMDPDTSGSSDEESVEEDPHRSRRPVPCVPRATSEDLLAERLLYGPVDAVENLLVLDNIDPAHAVASAGVLTDATARLASQNNSSHGRVPRIRRASPGRSQQPREKSPVRQLGFTINVPKAPYARGRRLLVPSDRNLPITAVYMRGDLQFIDQTQRVRHSRFSLPIEDETRHVVDAQLLNEDVAVMAYDRGQTQISCISLVKNPQPSRYDLLHRAHTTVQEHRRTGTSSPNRGISSICRLEDRSHSFLSAGIDGTIHLWTLTREPDTVFSATSRALGIVHQQRISCLGYRGYDRKVLSCYSQYIHCDDIETSLPSKVAMYLSSKPHQIHVHPQNPSIVILEVDHCHRQIQIFDTRKNNFRGVPSIEFGYPMKPKDGMRKVYRHYKGSTIHSLFARGFPDGTACVWDYRKPGAVCRLFVEERDDPIEHAVLTDTNFLLAYGGHTVTYWSLNST